MLHTENVFSGHRPFRMEAEWLEEKTVSDIIKNAWISTVVRGWACYRLFKKLMVIKQKLLQWKREHNISIKYDIDNTTINIRAIDIDIESSGVFLIKMANDRGNLINHMHDLMRMDEIY
ncbi:hypothetical protein AMTRI_Chr05g57170 [Amborella trichopoda]